VRNGASGGRENVAIDQDGSPAWRIDVELSLRDENAGESWDIAGLTSILGKGLSRHWRAGDIYPKTGHPRRFHFAGWRSPLPPESSLAAHLESMLELLEHEHGRGDEIRKYDPCVSVMPHSIRRVRRSLIEPDLMRRIGATGAALSIDLFVG
jgi:hypothetical protein